MTDIIKVVETNDFDETDEECSIIGADNINKNIVFLIICKGKTVLFNINELSSSKFSTLASILFELRLMSLEVQEMMVYIGSSLDRNSVIQDLSGIEVPFIVCTPYNNDGTDSIAYDLTNKKTFGITNSKKGHELIDFNEPNLKLSLYNSNI